MRIAPFFTPDGILEVRLSVIIITKNEINSIAACIASARFADEVIVVDSGSTDGTVELCRQLGARVEETDWPGFGPQKNRALALAQGEWVLSLDADERVTEELRDEILQAMASGDARPCALPRLSTYLGRPMRHSGWWPDYVVRLFKRGTARFSDDLVHERLVFDGQSNTLKSPLMHETYVDFEEIIDKFNRYSSAGAKMAQARGKDSSLLLAIAKGLFTFFRTYILRAGFLDGREGFMLAVSNAEATYYRQVKLMVMNHPYQQP